MSTKIEFNYTQHSLPYVYNGITWDSPEAHKFSAVGTPTSSGSFIRLYDNNTTHPSWFKYGTTYEVHLEKTGSTAKVRFQILIRQNGSWVTKVNTLTDTTFNIHEDTSYTGMIIRLRVLGTAGNVNEVVYPYLIERDRFVPRLNSNGMVGSKYWYNSSWNPYYPANGLPNCTCYAWGRWAEIMDVVPTGLGRHNAETWWNETTGFNKGQTPKLGAIICFADGPYSGLGHVAVVEQIDSDGTVTFSNSAYNGQYFYLRSGKASNNYGYERAYRLQGFIYLPDEYDPHPPEPIPPIHFKKPLWFYCKRKPF